MILEACPTLNDYPEPIEDLAGIVAAGRYLRASLGANESAWTEAVAEIGLVRAAVTVIYVLQLYDDDVSNAGRAGSRTRAAISAPWRASSKPAKSI